MTQEQTSLLTRLDTLVCDCGDNAPAGQCGECEDSFRTAVEALEDERFPLVADFSRNLLGYWLMLV